MVPEGWQEHTSCIQKRTVWPALDFTYLLQKDGEDPYLSHSLQTQCTTSPSSPASWALLGRRTPLFHHPPSFNTSDSLDDRAGQELTPDLQPWKLLWVALAPALKGLF